MKKITLTAGETVLHGMLNDTLAAREFAKRFPFKCCCHDSGMDYCGSAASGCFDPRETRNGWRNGDIVLCQGYFAILYEGEEQSESYRNMVVIAHINKEDLCLIRSLPASIHLVVDYER